MRNATVHFDECIIAKIREKLKNCEFTRIELIEYMDVLDEFQERYSEMLQKIGDDVFTSMVDPLFAEPAEEVMRAIRHEYYNMQEAIKHYLDCENFSRNKDKDAWLKMCMFLHPQKTEERLSWETCDFDYIAQAVKTAQILIHREGSENK